MALRHVGLTADDPYETRRRASGRSHDELGDTLIRLARVETDIGVASDLLAALEEILNRFVSNPSLDHADYRGMVVTRELVADLIAHTSHDLAVARRRFSALTKRLGSAMESTPSAQRRDS